jgi:hypothetical protein
MVMLLVAQRALTRQTTMHPGRACQPLPVYIPHTEERPPGCATSRGAVLCSRPAGAAAPGRGSIGPGAAYPPGRNRCSKGKGWPPDAQRGPGGKSGEISGALPSAAKAVGRTPGNRGWKMLEECDPGRGGPNHAQRSGAHRIGGCAWAVRRSRLRPPMMYRKAVGPGSKGPTAPREPSPAARACPEEHSKITLKKEGGPAPTRSTAGCSCGWRGPVGNPVFHGGGPAASKRRRKE